MSLRYLCREAWSNGVCIMQSDVLSVSVQVSVQSIDLLV